MKRMLTMFSKILSCIVYAKRPLRLEELCEAIGICGGDYGQNFSAEETLFKGKVLELCSPMVQIQEVPIEEAGVQNVCSLIHGSVRSFLIKNPRILHDEQTDECPDDFLITNIKLANTCLKCLMQPRYKRSLEKIGDTFKTSAGEDILQHQLLVYAAKY